MPAGTYTTKVQAGGSGDNIVPNGYIKQTERVWADTYTIAFTGTNSTIDMAIVQDGAIITGIQFVVDSSASQSSGTISIGYSTDANVDTFLAATNISHNLTRSVISLPTPGLLQSYASATITNATQVLQSFATLGGFLATPSGTQTTISIKLNNWTMTTGTVKSIVRYLGR